MNVSQTVFLHVSSERKASVLCITNGREMSKKSQNSPFLNQNFSFWLKKTDNCWNVIEIIDYKKVNFDYDVFRPTILHNPDPFELLRGHSFASNVRRLLSIAWLETKTRFQSVFEPFQTVSTQHLTVEMFKKSFQKSPRNPISVSPQTFDACLPHWMRLLLSFLFGGIFVCLCVI